MNKNDIKKGCYACISGYCTGCPYDDCYVDCRNELQKDALDLITEQEKDIKQLKTECALLDDELRIARQNTIDVLNKLKEKVKNAIDTYYNLTGGGYYSAEDVIDEIERLTDETRKAFDAANAKAHELNEIAVEGLKWRD